MEEAKKQKDEGNQMFKNKKMKEAISLYNDSLASLSKVSNENEELKKLELTLYQNLSLVQN